MEVIVYSTGPECMQCKQTIRELDKRNIPYTVVDLRANDEALNRLRGLGFTQAPVVESPAGTWAGFRPDMIRQLAA